MQDLSGFSDITHPAVLVRSLLQLILFSRHQLKAAQQHPRHPCGLGPGDELNQSHGERWLRLQLRTTRWLAWNAQACENTLEWLTSHEMALEHCTLGDFFSTVSAVGFDKAV